MFEYKIEYRVDPNDTVWFYYDTYNNEENVADVMNRLLDGGLFTEIRILVREVSEWTQITFSR